MGTRVGFEILEHQIPISELPTKPLANEHLVCPECGNLLPYEVALRSHRRDFHGVSYEEQATHSAE